MDISNALNSFSALSQETRLAVFRLLVKAGTSGMAAGEIAAALDVRQNTMSANLAVLARSGLISSRREGRVIRYFANMEAVKQFLAFMLEDCCGGNPEKCQPVIDEISLAC
ncbi:MAG: metalloregulator ArsR/SmtB family transcription factor [Pseudomonadota bacterium]